MSVHSAPMSRIPVAKNKRQDYGRTESAPGNVSKLEAMRAQYQQKMNAERERGKLIHMYEFDQSDSGHRHRPNHSKHQAGLVREFFRERREMERIDVAGTPRELFKNDINLHYTKKRAEYGKPPVYAKKSAGRDKSAPLAPINNKTNYDNNRNPQDSSPFGGPSKLPAPISNNKNNNKLRRTYDSDSDVLENAKNQPRQIPIPTAKVYRKKAKEPQEETEPKLTAFQKWQIEQNKEREERLQKHYGSNNETQESSPSDYSSSPKHNTPRDVKVKREKNKILAKQRMKQMQYSDNEDEEYSSESGLDQETQKRELELKAMIQRQQAELAKLRAQTAKEEEQERREAERQRRQHEKLQRDREREEQLERERQAELQKHETPQNEDPPIRMKPITPSRKKRKPPPIHRPQPPPEPQEDEEPRDVSGANAYLEKLDNADAMGEAVEMAECSSCGRRFAADRLSRHMKVCQSNAGKKRKVFDPVKMRTEGTEQAQYVNIHKKRQARQPPKPPAKNNNWRKQHENFIEAIRYAKKVSEVEKQGGNLSELPPPPVSENPDYVSCPHCQRRFNSSAAERHIPKCQSLGTKPAKGGRRR